VDLGPLATELLRRLEAAPAAHGRFCGPSVDVAGLSPAELGALWPAIHRALQAGATNLAACSLATRVKQQVEELELWPDLDPEACVATFRLVGVQAWSRAIEQLRYVPADVPPALAPELRRILGDPGGWPQARFAATALARLAGAATEEEARRVLCAREEDRPLLRQELEGLARLELASLLALATAECEHFYLGLAGRTPDPAIALARDAAYAGLARELVEAAARRLDDVHRGAVPYAADRAFSVEEAEVVSRAARAALLRDEPWLRPLVGELLERCCVAPTAARTAPSQSLAIALGHSIERAPTPEGLEALHGALAAVRHAGVRAKLARNVKPAERALARRPEVALRVVGRLRPGKGAVELLARFLEAGFCQELELELPEWRDALAASPAGAPVAGALVWVARRGGTRLGSFLPVRRDGRLVLEDARGEAVTPPDDARIALWHPVLAGDDEREWWRALVARRRLRQPLRQVYREFYRPGPGEEDGDTTVAFAGHVVAIRPLVGLARREGWRPDGHGVLLRRFGPVEVAFQVEGPLYPGAEGYAEVERVRFAVRAGRGWRRARIGELPLVVFSEACRAVDLLVSTSAFALSGEGPPAPAPEPGRAVAVPRCPADPRLARLAGLGLGEMAATRREALRHAFADEVASGAVGFEGRHVRVGPYAVHLSTARVTRDGAAVALEFPAGRSNLEAVPWLPHDEVLLERIARAVGALLHRA
jgi:hypothetical protein